MTTRSKGCYEKTNRPGNLKAAAASASVRKTSAFSRTNINMCALYAVTASSCIVGTVRKTSARKALIFCSKEQGTGSRGPGRGRGRKWGRGEREGEG